MVFDTLLILNIDLSDSFVECFVPYFTSSAKALLARVFGKSKLSFPKTQRFSFVEDLCARRNRPSTLDLRSTYEACHVLNCNDV